MTLLLALALLTAAPDTLQLDACYRAAEENHPRRRELALQDELATLRVDNLNARHLPALSLQGQAVYYSDVPSVPLPAEPGSRTPTVSNDQYKVALDATQLIYDGGRTGAQKALEYVQRDLARQEVVVDLYALREQVNGAYFGVLVQQARQASLQTLAGDLEARLEEVRARVAQGVALPSGADVLEVELLRVAQQQAEAEAGRRSALAVLGELMGRPLSEDVVLVLPEVSLGEVAQAGRRRPEYALFALSQDRLAQQQSLAARQNYPTVSGFAEAAFGRPPGLDFFNDTFSPFYSLGLRVQWPFWDWQVSRREQAALALQQEIVAAQEDAFDQQLAVATARQVRDIERLEEQLRQDEAIIALRARITEQAAHQLDGGVITATEYLTERNAEYQARLTQQLHAIQLAQATAEYLTTRGER